MSAAVKLAAAMPADFETNGIDAIAGQLVEEPDTLRVAVVWFDVKSVTHDTDTDDHIPTIRLRRIEPLGEAGEVAAAIRDVVQTAVQTRTGRKPIPFDAAGVAEGYDPDQGTIDEELDQ